MVKPRSMVADLDALPFATPGVEERPALAGPRKCRRHEWVWAGDLPEHGERCRFCYRLRDAVASRRGRNNRNRGNAIEREIAAKLGLRRVGQYGGADDVRGDLFAAQVKSGGRFPELFWRWLKAVPTDAGQTPLLVVTDAPGPGHKRRALVIVDLTDWAALHGRETEVEVA